MSPRRVRLDLAYDGTDFSGWQVQPGRRTVQGVLGEALARIEGGSPVPVRGAGRTDAGAHARGQVADVLLAAPIDDDALAAALRAMLPADVRVWRVRTVPDAFHARYDALSKTYAYVLDRSRAGNPFLARYAWHRPWPLDGGALEAGLEALLGRHDWSGFTSASCEVEDRVRTMSQARYEQRGAVGVFRLRADGFLTHMVRAIVGTLLDVARGRFAPRRVADVLATGDRGLAGPTAPARGLVLERVQYPAEAGGDDPPAVPGLG